MTSEVFSFRFYLAAIGTGNLAAGLQTVLYPWLLVGILDASPSQLGFAQMALLIPNLLFILPGGVLSDRLHRGTWLAILYTLYLVPLALLLELAARTQLSITAVVLFGLLFGTLTALIQPARDSLMVYTDSFVMHQSLARVLVIKFVAQGIGFMFAGLLGYIDFITLLVVQMTLFVMTALLFLRSHPRLVSLSRPTRPPQNAWRELREGFALFRDDTRLLHLLYLVFATGLLPFGLFLVGLPLLAREMDDGGPMLLATMQILFTLGVVAANLGVIKKEKTFSQPGKLMVISFFWRGSLLVIIAFTPDFWLLFPTLFLWGFSSGLSMVLGRTILHNQVVASHRARAISLYQLCLLGGTPIGAWFCGGLIEGIGLTSAFASVAVVTAVIALAVALGSPLWHLPANPDLIEPIKET